MKRSRRELSIDMVIDRSVLKNKLISRFPLFYLTKNKDGKT